MFLLVCSSMFLDPQNMFCTWSGVPMPYLFYVCFKCKIRFRTYGIHHNIKIWTKNFTIPRDYEGGGGPDPFIVKDYENGPFFFAAFPKRLWGRHRAEIMFSCREEMNSPFWRIIISHSPTVPPELWPKFAALSAESKNPASCGRHKHRKLKGGGGVTS